MDLKVDYAFKQLFGNEKNKDITVVLLNAFLQKTGLKQGKEELKQGKEELEQERERLKQGEEELEQERKRLEKETKEMVSRRLLAKGIDIESIAESTGLMKDRIIEIHRGMQW